MYQIFVNDKPIILTTKAHKEDGVKNYLLSEVNLVKVIKKLGASNLKQINLVGKKEHKLLKKFLKKLPNVTAGGGKVYNDDGKILFIFRNNKWDLPKGKAEGKEHIEETAVREVEEETGVEDLEIVKQIDTTYHIFKRQGKYKIKVTHWFEMKTTYSGKLRPEKKEGISKAKWLGKKEVKRALKNSYANIKGLI